MSIRASLVYILWYLIALHKTAELFRLSGKPSAARRLSKAAQALRQALKKLVQADGLIGDGFSDAGKRVRTTSIHAQSSPAVASGNCKLEPKFLTSMQNPNEILFNQFQPNMIKTFHVSFCICR